VPSCLAVAVTNDADAELAADALWSLGAIAIEERARSLVAGFADDAAVENARAAIGRRWSTWVLDVADDWREALRSSPNVVVVSDVVTIDIDAGRVFGDGAHPTTRMALDALVGLVRPGASVLDLGCGSGVLAVAAARLGAARVVAVDVDAEAVDVTRANAARNGVADVVDGTTISVADVDGTFDVVVANLGGRVVVEVLAPVLAARTARPDGALVVGGLVDDDAPPPSIPGLSTTAVVRRDGWATMVYT
jgi:ribosomal protein L11 methylase PrmA